MNAIVEKQSEIVAVDQTSAVLQVLQDGLNKGLDADSLEKMLNMQERILNRQAEQAFYAALVKVQQEMPVIEKNRDNKQTSSSYADLEQINKKATPIFTKHGFCISFGNADSPLPEHVRVVADLMHIQGYKRDYLVDVPLDMVGIKGNQNKTQVHGTASAISYGKRYLICLIFNINTGDDDDGNAAGGDTRTVMDVENWWFAHMDVLKTLIPTIMQVKESLRDKDYHRFFEAWAELSKEELDAIWHPAPTRGGILTTLERDLIRSTDCQAVAKEIGYSSPK